MFYNTNNADEFFQLIDVTPTDEHLKRFNQFKDLMNRLIDENFIESSSIEPSIDSEKALDSQVLLKYIMLGDNFDEAIEVSRKYSDDKHEYLIEEEVNHLKENNQWFKDHDWAVQYLYSINVPPYKEMIIKCMECKEAIESDNADLIEKCHRYIKGEINEFQLGLKVKDKEMYDFFNEINVQPTKKNIKRYREFGSLMNHLTEKLIMAKLSKSESNELESDFRIVYSYIIQLRGSKEEVQSIYHKYQ